MERGFDAADADIRWPGKGEIAVVVGSRGIADIHKVTKAVVERLKRSGYSPFIVPGMGSHGGATAEGQREVWKASA